MAIKNHNRIKNLGQIAASVKAVIHKFDIECAETHSDLRAFGAPSECWGLAFHGFDERRASEIVAAVHKYKVSYNIFKEELRERVNTKWLFYNSFFDLP